MSDVPLILLLFKKLNDETLSIFLKPTATEEDVSIALLEADYAVEKFLEPYRAQFVDPGAFKNLTEELQNKFRKKIKAKAEALRGTKI
jgi:hypothetical protein